MSAREQAEQQVADMLGLPVEKIRANERAEIAHARDQGKPVEIVGPTYRMVQEQLYANLRG